jgi:hypothetical protein
MTLVERDGFQADVEDLIRTVTPDLYRAEDLVRWEQVSAQLEAWQPGIRALEHLATTAYKDQSALGSVLAEEPSAYEVLKRLLSMRGAIGFADGRELPARLSDVHNLNSVAELFTDIGVWEVLKPYARVEPMAKVALIAAGADRRRFNVRGRLDEWVKQAVTVAIETIEQDSGLQLAMADPRSVPVLKDSSAPRALDYILTVDGSPFAAVATVFQTSSGGRQQRDLARTYSALQRELDEVPAGLILIVDGRGIRETPRRVLSEMITGVAACMTFRQADEGALATALIDLAKHSGVREELTAPLDRLIENLLHDKLRVDVADLPVSQDRGRLALVGYETDHPELALTLTSDGTALEWTRIDSVRRAARLSSMNQEDAVRSAVEVFAELIEASLVARPTPSSSVEASYTVVVEKRQDPVLPRYTLVMSSPDAPTAFVLRSTAKESAKEASEAKLAVLIAPIAPPPEEFAGLQAALAATVVVLDYQDLLKIAQTAELPRDGFVSAVLERADVAKVSPFVVRSVTPERIFFGREKEQATLVSTLASNSVALLGGRRIGKTSLLRRAESWLRDGDFFPVFGDCQTVGSWEEFGRLVRREWECEVPHDFKPPNLFDVVEQLADRSNNRLVFLLDEIDHLLSRDQSVEFEGVREAFFRACRAISQQGLAQFVFSGERTIAKKLWDPQSPHWNFCRPLQLRQLDREPAERLLVTPLQSLGIELLNEAEFRQLAWRFTSGHPQLIQLLGDRLVDLVSDKPRGSRGQLALDDLAEVVERLSYAEPYLETYWGQATDLEKLVSAVVAMGLTVPKEITAYVSERYNIPLTGDAALAALRMLELYGIVDPEKDGYKIRAEWFGDALEWYGGAQQVGRRYADKVVG